MRPNRHVWTWMILILALAAYAQDLQPVPPAQAIQQYQEFWKTDNPDPMNHVVWKLYVFRSVPPHNSPKNAPTYLIAGLTPYSKKSFYVGLRVNQLYNWLHPPPKRGSVIVVSGRVLTHRHSPVLLPSGMRDLDYLTMDLDGAILLPNEKFDPAAPPPTPTAGTSPSPSPLPR